MTLSCHLVGPLDLIHLEHEPVDALTCGFPLIRHPYIMPGGCHKV
jgi:hypothetical protein